MSNLSKRINELKSHSYDTVSSTNRYRIPLILHNVRYIDTLTYTGEVDVVNKDNNNLRNWYLDVLIKDSIERDGEPENIEYLKSIRETIERKCIPMGVKKFHYDDTWYSYRFSIDKPEETFGIVKIDNIPYKSLYKLIYKKSFICRMDQMVYNNLVVPFMVFVNGKFVNWNNIDVVFDGNTTYLLLHGNQYNNYDLERAEIAICILPFNIEFIGNEDELVWQKNYDMVQNYLQDSLIINQDGKIEINVPTMDSIYKKNGMIFNVGAWIYAQVRMNHLGLLSQDKISKLQRIYVTKYEYDNSGNITSSFSTRFNALDKDSYDIKIYEDLCFYNYDYITDKILFRFNDDGELDPNGDNMIINLDDSIKTTYVSSNSSTIVINDSEHENTMLNNNYIIFKNNKLWVDYSLTSYGANISTLDNPNYDNIKAYGFINPEISSIYHNYDNFITKEYYANKIVEIVRDNNMSSYPDFMKVVEEVSKPLNIAFNNNDSYEDNIKNTVNNALNYNPLLIKDINEPLIKSTVLTGREANSKLIRLSLDQRRGIKFPRYKYDDHETYAIVFVNGELIDTYCDLYVAPNYFFLPVNEEFASGDTIELMYFTQCNNIEIDFKMTNNMISILQDSLYVLVKDIIERENFSPTPVYDLNVFSYIDYDGIPVRDGIFKQFIKYEDLKIFAQYPKEVLVYKELITEQNDNIAFNVSYRNINNRLVLFNETVDHMDTNSYCAVSSRKFVYEKLNVSERTYRLKLGKQFKYCDNLSQYMFFINGRRIDDTGFLITIPKYSRPFWDKYIYTARFVNPTDRVEVFYVPEEVRNINTKETPVRFDSKGYIECNISDLEAPYSKDQYLYFVNGKKIPYTNIVDVSSNTVRVSKDTLSTNKISVSKSFRYGDSTLAEYMKSGTLSTYDEVIEFIKNSTEMGYNELDNLFGVYAKMSDIEVDMIHQNVDQIAILNEIIRDFWVSSGYDYNKKPFVYDYVLDEFISYDEENDSYLLPSLDALPEININIGDELRLLYFSTNKDTFVFEAGSTIDDLVISWEFSRPIDGTPLNILSQSVDGINIPVTDRQYAVPTIQENNTYSFIFSDLDTTIKQDIPIKFYNGVYYGSVSKDIIDNLAEEEKLFFYYFFIRDNDEVIFEDLEFIKDGESKYGDFIITRDEDGFIIRHEYDDHQEVIVPMPWEDGVDIGSNEFTVLCMDGRVIKNITALDLDGNPIYSEEYVDWLNTKSEDDEFVVATAEGAVYANMKSAPITLATENIEDGSYVPDGYSLHDIFGLLNKSLQNTCQLDITQYQIGSNNYFVYACPNRLLYNDNELEVVFTMPNLSDPDIVNHNKNGQPIYINSANQVLTEYTMVKLAEVEYINNYGYAEMYTIFISNGYFTSRFSDYMFNMSITAKGGITVIDNIIEIPIGGDGSNDNIPAVASETSEPTETRTFRAVNTAAPRAIDKASENIVMLNAIIL